MINKVTGFAYINGIDVKVLSYTLNIYDDNMNLIRANVRKSTTLKESDVETINGINGIIDFILSKENGY